ncbi:hypothetical protein SDC9_180201 [bioreactor metagenome]|uniref:Uncharacterized protein n=1 Tax=bioreactor metagenome TaxID=1076179 RepID=A0A645H0Z6_9ZZZZ
MSFCSHYLLDLLFLGVHVRLDQSHFTHPLSRHAGLNVELLFFLLDDGFFLSHDHCAFALHLNANFGDLRIAVHLRQGYRAFAAHAGLFAFLHRFLFQALLLLLYREFALLDCPVHILSAQPDRLLGFQPLVFDFLAARLNDLAGLSFLIRLHLGDGAGLFGGIGLVAPFLLALGDVGIGVLLFDLHTGPL